MITGRSNVVVYHHLPMMKMMPDVLPTQTNSSPTQDSSTDFSRLIWQVIPVIICTTCLQYIKTAMPEISSQITKYLQTAMKHCFKKKFGDEKQLETVTISYSLNGKGGVIDSNGSYGAYVRRALIEFVTRQQLFCHKSEFILGAGQVSATNPFKFEQSRTKLLLPLEPVVYDDITIHFTQQGGKRKKVDLKDNENSGQKDGL